MANVMLKTPYYYNPVGVGMQDLSDEAEPTSHPISCHLDSPERDAVVDVNTLQRMASGSDTGVVRGLVIEKIRRDVSYYVGRAYSKKRMIVEDHGNLRFERYTCMNYNTYLLDRICSVESATDRPMSLTLGYQCMTDLLDVTATDFCVMDKTVLTN